MVKRIFHSKLFVLFLSMYIMGFFIGYSYSVRTVGKSNGVQAKVEEPLKKMSVQEGKTVEESGGPEESVSEEPPLEDLQGQER